MSVREFIKDYLTFSRRERIAVLAIAGLMILIFFTPKILYKSTKPASSPSDTTWIAAIKKLQVKGGDSENDPKTENDELTSSDFEIDRTVPNTYSSGNNKAELFVFDPNTISESEWSRLGLRQKTISTIKNYLSKGGHFYKPEDLQKIYGLSKKDYERLLPFVKIENKRASMTKEVYTSKPPSENNNSNSYSSRYSIIDINSADTSAFISLPGIGSKLASRIVLFRDKLGGFYSVEQIGETYGLPDSTFQKIKHHLKLDNPSVKKININTASVDEMKVHPYIKFSLANPIVAYRNEHGAFSKIEDIKKVMAVTDEIFKKVAPYLTIQ